MKRLAFLTVTVGLASCTAVGPDHVAPQANMPVQFAMAQSTDIDNIADDRWWEGFADPLLNAYMQRSLAQSLEIKFARERITEAQALYRAAGGGGLPAAQLSGDLRLNTTTTVANSRTTGNDVGTLGADFVFDVFGGASRNIEAAGASVEAAALDVWVTRLAFQMELIGAYIDVRFFQNAIAITNEAIANRKRTLGLVRVQMTINDVTTLEVTRAEAELSVVQARLPTEKIGFDSNAVRLAALLKIPVSDVMAQLTKSNTGIPMPKRLFDAGVPTSLLRNRPDIRVAERQLAARMAAVGVSEAALYPSLSLGGFIRAGTDNTLQIGPALVIPLLNRPRLIANRDAAVSRARQSELNWQITVQDAISEVEQTLSRAKNRREEIAALTRALRDYQKLARLVQDSYELRSSTLLELLDAAENVTDTASDLARSKREYATAVAELAVATGRGTRALEELPVPPISTAP
jgi:multidrug efflux system outer membrane protein